MIHASEENMFSPSDEDERYDPVAFDPEATFVDDGRDGDAFDGEHDGDTLALRDAMRDIWSSEGRFEVLLP